MGVLNSDFNGETNITTQMEFEWGDNYEYMVDATIDWSFEGHDGIGAYEYHGSKEYDQGKPVYEIDLIRFTVWDENSNEVILSDGIRFAILDHIKNNAEINFY